MYVYKRHGPGCGGTRNGRPSAVRLPATGSAMTAARRVAVYAGTFDPPAAHHRRIAERLAEASDEVIVLPAGPRPDRPEAESLPVHRAVMADLNFRGLPKVRVDLGDLERGRFTPNREFANRFGGPGVELSHVVPVAAATPAAPGRESRIQTEWGDGRRLWKTAHFTVLHEPAEPVDAGLLPPRHAAIAVPPHATTAQIRADLFDGVTAAGVLHPPVADYIKRHGLFRPTPPARECIVRVPAPPKLRLVYDERNDAALKLIGQLKPYECADPEVVVAVGGDGTMLRAIRQHWRDRLPFYGLNTGHLGFLLNNRTPLAFWERDLRLYQLPLLWVELTAADGTVTESLAFNDCWVERETGQTAWVEVGVNGKTRMPRVVADGMLVATAAGSTSYARAMGASPLPFNAGVLTLAGSNVLKPEFWRPAVLPGDSAVTVTNLDPIKRPLQGFVDGVDMGRVAAMTARVSNIAAVELLFAPAHDPAAKLAMLQFPQPG